MKNHSRHRHGSGDRGQSIVEFCLVVPILLVLVMGVIDFAWGMRAYITITNAAREGARVAVVCGGTGASTWSAAQSPIQTAAVNKSNGLLSSSNVTVSNTSGNCTTGQDVSVSTAYNYSYITPVGGLLRLLSAGAIPSPLHMSSSTTMRVE